MRDRHRELRDRHRPAFRRPAAAAQARGARARPVHVQYISGVQNVVAILPPGHTVQSSTLTLKPPSANAKSTVKPVDIALLFLKDELKPWLDHPLSATFPEQFPPSVPELGAWSQTQEAGLVSQITASGLFTEKLVQAQDGSNLILLDPQPPQ